MKLFKKGSMKTNLSLRGAAVLAVLAFSALACNFGLGTSGSGPANALGTEGAPIQISQDLLSQQEALVSLYEAVSPGVVSINVSSSIGGAQGSGFVYDKDGHIVTNFHVVEDANYIEVSFPTGFTSVGEVIGEDRDSDLAVIKVEAPEAELHPLSLADSEQLLVGQYVVAIGNPFGLSSSMSLGIVSSLGRSLDSMNSTEDGLLFSAGDLIQTDAAINPGNSGGPLLNLSGQVVGVNRAIRTFSSAEDGNALNSGVGFAISSNIIARVVPSLIAEGDYEYPYLGISSRSELSLAEAQELGLETNAGALVTNVVANGPADDAGLQAEDFIIAIDGRPIKDFDEMIAYLFTHKSPGELATLSVIRGGEQIDIQLTLGARP
jgi:S1-C subfamily serine protease